MATHASPLDESSVSELEEHFRGTLLRATDLEYDDARSVWNGMIDKRPTLIARCRGVADIIDAVNFAREHGLPIAVRGGGHNVAGSAGCDDGIVIDLSEMTGVHVDPDRKVARVEAGATWADVDRETQVFGLATPWESLPEAGATATAFTCPPLAGWGESNSINLYRFLSSSGD